MKMITLLMTMMFSFAVMAAETKKTFNVAWSLYPSWQMLSYSDTAGILKKHADKHGIKINLVKVGDYLESINLYTAQKFDACTMVVSDALTIPAVGGVDSTVVIVNSYSNGNDKILSKSAKTLQELKGKNLSLPLFSVSHYLLARALSMTNDPKTGKPMKESDVKVTNISDVDFESTFISSSANVVAWNPAANNMSKMKGASVVFDSSKIPGEIIDATVVHTSAPDSLKYALAAAYEEIAQVVKATGGKKDAVVKFMAKDANTTVQNIEEQLKTTYVFDSKEGASFVKGAKIKETIKYIRDFSFDKGLFSGKSREAIGVQYPDGTVLGSDKNIKLRFDAKYMEAATKG